MATLHATARESMPGVEWVVDESNPKKAQSSNICCTVKKAANPFGRAKIDTSRSVERRTTNMFFIAV